jgi:hypothetical protein
MAIMIRAGSRAFLKCGAPDAGLGSPEVRIDEFVATALRCRMFVRICPHFPFSARICLNQHHWLANRMREKGIQLLRLAARSLTERWNWFAISRRVDRTTDASRKPA